MEEGQEEKCKLGAMFCLSEQVVGVMRALLIIGD